MSDKERFVLPHTLEKIKQMTDKELAEFREYHVKTTYGDLVWAADNEIERRKKAQP